MCATPIARLLALAGVLIRDRDAYRRSLEHLLALQLDRLIPAHGEVVEGAGASDALRGARR